MILAGIGCLIIWLVMQGGNAACGKTVGTLMGIGCIAIQLIAIGAFIVIGLIPFILGTLPVIAFFLAVVKIVGICMGSSKRKAATIGDGTGVVRCPQLGCQVTQTTALYAYGQ